MDANVAHAHEGYRALCEIETQQGHYSATRSYKFLVTFGHDVTQGQGAASLDATDSSLSRFCRSLATA
jgi:hypothetical protein